MRDLERAGRAVVEDPAFPPTPVELIEQRGMRRRRGLQLRAAVALACVVTVVGGAVAFALDRHTTTKPVVTVQPRESSTISEAQMRAHLGDGVPHGWVPVDFGDARIYVPRAWSVTTEGCASEPSPGWIELGASYQGGCMGPADRKPFVQITGAVSPTHSPDPARVVHGYRLYAVGASAAGTYAVPDLATTFHVDGAAAEQVLATLAPSSEFVALNYHAPIPSDG